MLVLLNPSAESDMSIAIDAIKDEDVIPPRSRNPGTGVSVSTPTGLDSRVRGNGTFVATVKSIGADLALRDVLRFFRFASE